MFPGRCQYKDRYGQCALYEGHDGEHKSEALLKREAYEEAHPSLSAIRRVVREEIRAALAEMAASEQIIRRGGVMAELRLEISEEHAGALIDMLNDAANGPPSVWVSFEFDGVGCPGRAKLGFQVPSGFSAVTVTVFTADGCSANVNNAGS